MPEYTHDDRCMIDTESTLWAVWTLLKDIESSGAWRDRIVALRDEACAIGKELRDYNDQFEVEE